METLHFDLFLQQQDDTELRYILRSELDTIVLSKDLDSYEMQMLTALWKNTFV